jgi:hypothetical protein
VTDYRLVRRLAALTLVLLLALTAGCGRWNGHVNGGEPTTPATATDVPSGTPTEAADLVGDWTDAEADWTVHFKADGTYVQDYQGVDGFLSGTYKLVDGQVQLISGEGDADLGKVEGDTLVFKLGTLTRAAHAAHGE